MTTHEKKRVLITGASGFTGRYVWAACEAAGYYPIQPLHGFNLSSIESCRATIEGTKPDYVIHLAAISFVSHPDHSAFYQINTVGTINLLQAIRDVGLIPKHLIIASSANVYGNVPTQSQPISEKQPPAPENHYASSKLAMEYMASRWFDTFPITITRPFNYTGVGQNELFLVPKIIKHFTNHNPVIKLGNLDIARDYTDVRDVAEMYVNLLNAPKLQSCTVNVCSGNMYSLIQIIQLLSDKTQHEIEMISDNSFVRSNEILSIRGSNEKFMSNIGYEMKFPFETTLGWMLDT